MKLSWESSSEEGKLVLLVSAYEAFAREEARRMRKDFVLPRFTSYANLMRKPTSAKDAERLARTRRVFRKLVRILDKEGILYRDYLEGVFSMWKTPRRRKSVYLARHNVPAAFPLPQHLLGQAHSVPPAHTHEMARPHVLSTGMSL